MVLAHQIILWDTPYPNQTISQYDPMVSTNQIMLKGYPVSKPNHIPHISNGFKQGQKETFVSIQKYLLQTKRHKDIKTIFSLIETS